MLKRFFRFCTILLFGSRGSSPVVAVVVLLPLLAATAWGFAWLGHMADAKNVVEEAARAGARWLASHPSDIEGAKSRAAEVVTAALEQGRSFIPGGAIPGVSLDNVLVGKLTKSGNSYTIHDRTRGPVKAKPASPDVKAQMDALVNKVVAAGGDWVEAGVFLAKVATTDPPEVQTVQQQGGSSTGQPGTQGSQTVNQVRHPGPFPAAVLAQYGQGIWGTWWAPAWPDLGAQWIWGQPGAGGCAPNGQEVMLTSPVFWTAGYDKYRLYATADDWFNVRVDVTDVLQGTGTGVKTWDWEPGPSRPVQFVVTARNDYGPAGFLCSFKQTGWHWPVSYTPQPGPWGWFHYPGWTVPYAQWVNITAKNQYGQPVNIYVDDWTHNKPSVARGSGGKCSFYAYPGITYSVCLNSGTLNNDLVIDLDGGITLRSDSNWCYSPTDGVRYDTATLPQRMTPGAEFTVKVSATNLAHKEWFASRPSWWPNNWNSPDSWQTNFSYHWYDDRGNLVVQDGLRTGLPQNVPSGGAANLDLKIRAPSQAGRYRLVIDGVQEHCAWFGPVQGVNWPTLEAWIDVGGIDYSVSYDPAQVPKYMVAGETYTVRVTAKNTGSLAWTPQFGLAYHWYDKNSGKIVTWDGTRDYVDWTVAPGQSYTFSLPVTAPSRPGTYVLEIDMVHEDVTWFKDKNCPVLRADVEVPQGDVLKGPLTFDGDDYWVGNTIVRSAGPDLSQFAGMNVILWGQKERFFLVKSIQEYVPEDWTALVTFDPEKDVFCNDPKRGDPLAPVSDPASRPRSDNYAYCRVTYHYPVPLRNLWKALSGTGTPVWRSEEPFSRKVVGEAYFLSGEAGD